MRLLNSRCPDGQDASFRIVMHRAGSHPWRQPHANYLFVDDECQAAPTRNSCRNPVSGSKQAPIESEDYRITGRIIFEELFHIIDHWTGIPRTVKRASESVCPGVVRIPNEAVGPYDPAIGHELSPILQIGTVGISRRLRWILSAHTLNVVGRPYAQTRF